MHLAKVGLDLLLWILILRLCLVHRKFERKKIDKKIKKKKKVKKNKKNRVEIDKLFLFTTLNSFYLF